MNFRVITAPTKLPVSLDEVKAHLEITEPDDAGELALLDGKLTLFIGAAREAYEATADRTVHETVLEAYPDHWPYCGYIELPRAAPLVSVASVTLKDSDETETLWSAAEWIADTSAEPGRLMPRYGESWPDFIPSPARPVAIRYTAGIATASPEVEAEDAVKQPILMAIAAMYENREAELIVDGSPKSTLLLQMGFSFFLNLKRKTYKF